MLGVSAMASAWDTRMDTETASDARLEEMYDDLVELVSIIAASLMAIVAATRLVSVPVDGASGAILYGKGFSKRASVLKSHKMKLVEAR